MNNPWLERSRYGAQAIAWSLIAVMLLWPIVRLNWHVVQTWQTLSNGQWGMVIGALVLFGLCVYLAVLFFAQWREAGRQIVRTKSRHLSRHIQPETTGRGGDGK